MLIDHVGGAFFPLILSLLILWGITRRNWQGIGIALLALMVLGMWNFDYGLTGILPMLIFYFCRNKPVLGAVLFCASYLTALWGSPSDPLSVMIAGHAVQMSIFSLLAAPLISYTQTQGLR